MHWNYRVVRKYTPEPGNFEDYSYAIHEAHYKKNGSVEAVTENDIAACGESVEDVKWHLDMMQKALTKPVIDYDTLKEIGMGTQEA